VSPELEVPELNVSNPLAPAVPPFAVLIVIAPLVVAAPSPVIIVIKPPVCTVLSPAVSVIDPPAPLVPVPTVIDTAPPVPPVAAPVPIARAPVSPELDVPELKVRAPLAPAVPAFADLMVMAPVVVAVLAPDITDTAPPVTFAPRPAVSVIAPP
jgi:hypothetical protein